MWLLLQRPTTTPLFSSLPPTITCSFKIILFLLFSLLPPNPVLAGVQRGEGPSSRGLPANPWAAARNYIFNSRELTVVLNYFIETIIAPLLWNVSPQSFWNSLFWRSEMGRTEIGTWDFTFSLTNMTTSSIFSVPKCIYFNTYPIHQIYILSYVKYHMSSNS